MAGPACCAATTPVSTKMPVPMMQPMPSMVRSKAPRQRFRPVLALTSVGLVRNRLMRSPFEFVLSAGGRLCESPGPEPGTNAGKLPWAGRIIDRRHGWCLAAADPASAGP